MLYHNIYSYVPPTNLNIFHLSYIESTIAVTVPIL
nr:MAG TPA: hypothetical protein [Caudoviricetes sp.]